MEKIHSFTDLRAWKEAHHLVLMIYETAKKLPKEEQFGLTQQIRRAAVSITSNLAEGFSKQSYKEKLHFYSIALGSLTEIQNQLLIAKDVQYITSQNFEEIAQQSVIASKLINGLIKSTKTVIRNS